MVYLLFADGLVKSVSLSYYSNLRIKTNFVASNKVTLIAKGPDREQLMNIKIVQANRSVTLQAGISHFLLILAITLVILIFLYFCRHSHSKPEPTPEVTETPVDPNKEDNIEERLITKNNEDPDH